MTIEIQWTVAVVDFSNHHFIKQAVVQASTPELRFVYVYSSDFQSPNHPNAAANYGDEVVPVSLGEEFDKYSLFNRRKQERAWAAACGRALEDINPDAVIAANCPIDVLVGLHKWSKRIDTRFGVWVQDMYGPLMERLLKNKLFGLGRYVARHYSGRERTVLAEAHHVAAIDPSLQDIIERETWRRPSLLANWAAIEDLPQHPRRNPWSKKQDVAETQNVVYTGTLGLKHSPKVLADLAESLASVEDARVLVVSEGMGADLLAEMKAERNLDNLLLFPFQAPEDLAQVLGAARVCVLLLNAKASDFCVPSKVLGYLCAGRPVVGSLPERNPASRLIASLGVGETVSPDDSAALIRSVARYMDMEDDELDEIGFRGRAHAVQEFAPDVIGDRIRLLATNVLGTTNQMVVPSDTAGAA